jgi:hypothetical protein
MSHYAHAYLVGSLLALPLWLLLFYNRKDLAKKMLIMSVLGGALSVIFARAFLHDYWHPIYTFPLGSFGGIEDFLYGFFVVGIASVIYEEMLSRKVMVEKEENRYSSLALPALLIYVLVFYVPFYLGLPSIYSALIGFLVVLVIIVAIRRDLLLPALISGVLLSVLTLLGFIIFVNLYPGIVSHFWYLHNVNSASIVGIPAGELVWAFGLGAVSGSVYEFFAGHRFQKKPSRTTD